MPVIDSEFITGIIVVLPPRKRSNSVFSYLSHKKNTLSLQTKNKGYFGRVVRHRSAKPSTAVRIRQVPQRRMSIKSQAFRHPLSFKMMFLKQTFSDVSVVSGLHTCQYACYFSNFVGIINSITC